MTAPQPQGQPKKEKSLSKPKEGGYKGVKVVEFTPPSNEGEGMLTKNTPAVLESEREDDPMVSDTIFPLTVRIEIMVASSGQNGYLTALLDPGCTRCLVILGVEENWECS